MSGVMFGCAAVFSFLAQDIGGVVASTPSIYVVIGAELYRYRRRCRVLLVLVI